MHTLSYWRQSRPDPGPKSVKLESRVFYRRADLEQWLAEVDGRARPRADPTGWLGKAMEAAGRIDAATTSPWKLASTYAPLSIAEALARQQPNQPTPRKPHTSTPSDMLTVEDVAAMTRLSAGTLRYWRHTGGQLGPKSFKVDRRVMYRRADVEQWIQEAHDR